MQRANMTVAWGMQFQQPYYLLIIAFVLAVFMLNMFGLFEFRTPQLVYFSRFKLIGHNKFIKDEYLKRYRYIDVSSIIMKLFFYLLQ